MNDDITLEVEPTWVRDLKTEISHGVQVIDSRLDAIEANQDLQREAVRAIASRVSDASERLDRIELRQNNNSIRVAASSDIDLQHDAAIAKLILDLEALTKTQNTQLAILQKLEKVSENPLLRKVAYALGMALLAYLASKGVVLK